MKSKGGFNRCQLPWLSIKMGDIEMKEKEEVEKEMSETEIEKAVEKLRKDREVERRMKTKEKTG